MQQFLKTAARSAGAQVVSAQLFRQLLVAVDHAMTSFDFSLGRETFEPFAGTLKIGPFPRSQFALP